MKKIIIMLFALVLLLPFSINADVSVTPKYQVEVISKDGADTYENVDNEVVKRGHIDKGEILDAYYEDDIKGEEYTYCKNDKTGFVLIKSSDLRRLSGTILDNVIVNIICYVLIIGVSYKLTMMATKAFIKKRKEKVK